MMTGNNNQAKYEYGFIPTDDQLEVLKKVIEEINSIRTDIVQGFVPYDILNSSRKVTTKTLPMYFYVSKNDYEKMIDLADKYLSSLVPFDVFLEEHKEDISKGVYFGV